MQVIKNPETENFNVYLDSGVFVGAIVQKGKKYDLCINPIGNLKESFRFAAIHLKDVRRVAKKVLVQYGIE